MDGGGGGAIAFAISITRSLTIFIGYPTDPSHRGKKTEDHKTICDDDFHYHSTANLDCVRMITFCVTNILIRKL